MFALDRQDKISGDETTFELTSKGTLDLAEDNGDQLLISRHSGLFEFFFFIYFFQRNITMVVNKNAYGI